MSPVELSDVVELGAANAECPISSLAANDSYTSVAIGSRAAGVAFVTSIERASEGGTRLVLTQSCSPLVGVATLAPGTDYAVVCYCRRAYCSHYATSMCLSVLRYSHCSSLCVCRDVLCTTVWCSRRAFERVASCRCGTSPAGVLRVPSQSTTRHEFFLL